MTTITRIRLLVAACALAALAVLPALGLAASPSTATKPQSIPASGSAIVIAGTIHLEEVVSPLVLLDEGTVRGTPFGQGTTTQTYTLHPRTGIAETAIEIANDEGTVTIQAVSSYTTNNVTISFSGVARITGGTGAYAGLTSGALAFQALHSITGKREAFTLTGSTARPGLAAAASGLNVLGRTRNTGNPSPLVFTDAGTLSGPPFGTSTVESADTFSPSGTTASTTFTISSPTGRVSGTVVSAMKRNGATLTFRGRGIVTSATGDHAGLENSLVRYVASYTGKNGVVMYQTIGTGRDRDTTLAAVEAYAGQIGAELPGSLRG